MNIEEKILTHLKNSIGKKHLIYKGIKLGLFALPDFKHYKYQTLASRHSSLQKDGLIKRGNFGEFYITSKGLHFLEIRKRNTLKYFSKIDPSNKPKNLLVLYDIPEDKKKERDWFRLHLKNFGFILLQKSVWIGPSPLPKEFLDYVKEIELGENFKTFKLSKPYDKK